MSNPGMNGGHPLDDLAAYALAALDDDEQHAVEDHLARCLDCRAELAGHQETLAALTPNEAPPAAVWERVAASIGAPGLPDPHLAGGALPSAAPPGAGAPAPSPPAASPGGTSRPVLPVAPGEPRLDRPVRLGPSEGFGRDLEEGAGTSTAGTVSSLEEARRLLARRTAQLRWLGAAACLAVAVGIGGVVGYVVGASGDDGSGVTSADISALAAQASEQPGGVLGTLDDTGGQPVAQVVADQDGAFIVLEGLQDLPEGQAYQLWSLEGAEPVSLGMLGREGTNTVAFRLPPTISRLAISVAPTRGLTTPPGEFQAAGEVTPRT